MRFQLCEKKLFFNFDSTVSYHEDNAQSSVHLHLLLGCFFLLSGSHKVVVELNVALVTAIAAEVVVAATSAGASQSLLLLFRPAQQSLALGHGSARSVRINI